MRPARPIVQDAAWGTFLSYARMAKLVDAWDLKSLETYVSCRFESCSGHADAPADPVRQGRRARVLPDHPGGS